MNAQTLMGQLDPFGNRRKLLVSEQSTSDIIQAILKAHRDHSKDYAKIAPSFNASSRREIGRKIFDFLKNNVLYRIEPSSKQTVKSPAAILAQGYGDCKHYSLFAGGVLENLGVPFAYRFASYRMWDKSPQHVFVVINPGTKNEIWLDPVLPSYDQKKPYNYAIDKKMAIYSISGIQNENQIGSVKSAVKAVKKTAGKVLKKGTRLFLKVNVAPMRNAFLLLVKLNVGGLATKFSKAWEKNASKVQNFWEGLGGATSALKSAWTKGSKKKRIFGSSVGEVAVAATVTAAAPLLVKAANFFKQIGIDPAELVQIGKDAVNKKAQELAQKALDPKAASEARDIDLAEQAMDETGEAPKKMNILPLILAGGAIVYFVTRKK